MARAAQRLDDIRARIAKAAAIARRSAGEITLIAVTKGREMSDIEPLIAAGQRDFGESRVQEALAKWPPVLARHTDIRLHGIGRLQSNKTEEAVHLFDVIHSLDRVSLIEALGRAAQKEGRTPSIYLQVNIGEEPQKGGCAIEEVPNLLAEVRASTLCLEGLMAIPPLGVEPSPFFALLAKVADRNGLSGLSMGMSGDFEPAVMLGATAVRVGSTLFED
jgi:pyridoxal phosphate enzyme (YggS family)